MKVTLLSTFDQKGGAAIAASRLQQGLQQQGIDASLLVREKSGTNAHVIGPQGNLSQGWAKTRGVIDALPLQLYRSRDRQGNFFPQWLPNRLNRTLTTLKPELINLHWVSGGFVPIEALARWRKPLIWTLHDMWPMTGGCHYSGGCDRFEHQCGACPHLGSQQVWDLSRWVHSRKTTAWKTLPIQLVSPSQWLANQARASRLFHKTPFTVIPNGLDLTLYRPIEPHTARQILRLPQQGQLILFGADNATTDIRKGFQFLKPTLEKLKTLDLKGPIEIGIFGAADSAIAQKFPFRTHFLGRLQDTTSLVLAYSAADVFLLPSRQDNLPNTILEALACGTPCIGFNQGGLPDMIQHLQNGFLATPYDTNHLAEGLHWLLSCPARHQALSHQARATAEQKFSQTLQAQQYQTLFESTLRQASTSH